MLKRTSKEFKTAVLIPIEVSARHLHLKKSHFETLFGKGVELTVRNKLSQPGGFAAEETVTIKTKKAEIPNVRILGPFRDYTQIEISKSDAYRLGINPPIRASHELALEGTPGINLIGPAGTLELEKGVVIPWRHIHMSPNDALEADVSDGDVVKVDIDHHARSVIFENVFVRVKANYKLVMQIDTDEANASGIEGKGEGKLLVDNS